MERSASMKGEKVLLVEEVSKHFGGLEALRELSLSVERGKITGLIGPNGAGKTTLFNVISGFYKPNAGSVYFENENITGLSAHKICQKGIARTFQIAKPFEDLTVLKTVTIGALIRSSTMEQAEEKAKGILDHLKLWDKKDQLGRALNVVERRRLELARALASEPKLLLIDEVIAGLNPIEIDEVSEVIRGLLETGITIVMIEHVMRAILSLAERVIVLNAGTSIAEGPPKELLDSPIVIEAYIGKDDPGA